MSSEGIEKKLIELENLLKKEKEAREKAEQEVQEVKMVRHISCDGTVCHRVEVLLLLYKYEWIFLWLTLPGQ